MESVVLTFFATIITKSFQNILPETCTSHADSSIVGFGIFKLGDKVKNKRKIIFKLAHANLEKSLLLKAALDQHFQFLKGRVSCYSLF